VARKAKRARVQVAIRLEPEMLEKLQEDGHLSLSDEIRTRVNRTLFIDSYDQSTRLLAEDVMWLADEISRQVGSTWSYSHNGHLALGTAIQTWLEINAPPLHGAASDLFGPDDPTTLGRSVARHYQRVKSEMEKSTEEIPQIQKPELRRSRKGENP
jgi:hypothetical protein